ncbi:DUF2274 domain-containing protein [Pandoraea sp. B-6]|uniref:DUF2274 domain-containing protein n=1 Tax=unclassified Pandoraea TaxID=2624094 RepID=UPI0012FC60DB
MPSGFAGQRRLTARPHLCPADLQADLDRYVALRAQTYGETVDAATPIPHRLQAFMAGNEGCKWSSSPSRRPRNEKAAPAQTGAALDGARGRNRTGTTVRSRDFLTTSTFAASAFALFVVWSTPSP